MATKTLTVEIELDTDSMQAYFGITETLTELANKIRDITNPESEPAPGDRGFVKDYNGHNVGVWRVHG